MSTADEPRPVEGIVRLWFGKYKGDTVDSVAEKDPKYLIWAHEEIEWFKLPKEMYEALLMDDAEDDYGLTCEDLFGD